MSDAAAPASSARQRGILGFIERTGDRLPDPVMIFIWLIVFVFALSAIAAGLGWNAVNPASQETISATSLFTSANLERLIVEMPRTLTGFAPLGYVLLVMLGAGLAERSGLFGAAMRAAVKDAPKFLLTPLVIFVGIMANQAADAAYVVLIPLAGVLFAAAGRHPIVGIAAGFAGVAGGFSANLLPGQLDALLLGITEPAARLLVPDWTMNVAGNWYFIAAMAFFFTPVAWFVTDVIIAPRFGKWEPGPDAPPIQTADSALTDSEKKGLRAAGLAALAIALVFAVLTIPALWTNEYWAIEGGAPLYDEEKLAEGQPEQAMSPFYHGLVAAFFLLFLVCGIAYGRAAGVNKNHRDEIKMISDGMATMAYYIVLAFAAAHFVALFNWSNLGAITAIHGAQFLRGTGLPLPALLAGLVILGTTINLFVGS
ncbi:MAG: AbgT family transporter, partial [Hyphomonadaceae bacterium]